MRSAFQSTLSVRRTTGSQSNQSRATLFQSTLSVRRATYRMRDFDDSIMISIHALRKESDEWTVDIPGEQSRFQSTLSVRRATPAARKAFSKALFQSTLSVRRATGSRQAVGRAHDISIHALRKESDRPSAPGCLADLISIHALRKESDHWPRTAMTTARTTISIHALRKESDACRPAWISDC